MFVVAIFLQVACSSQAPRVEAATPPPSTRAARSPSTDSNLRALIVAASSYPADSGWATLNADQDERLLRKGLLARGFEDAHITSLTGPSVTKAAVVEALHTWAVQPGDHLFFHYSGHGQRITDLSGDEKDGYDEALVLLDTPTTKKQAGDDYRAELHLTDDELGAMVAALRAKVGPRGSVAVSLDSCHSATGTRGLPHRGLADFDLATSSTRREHRGSGFGDTIPTNDGGAPTVLLAATRSTDLAREIYGPDDKPGGALSIALAHVLSDEQGLETWRAVYEAVAARMRISVPGQVPQLEGSIDTVIFDGRREDVPYYTPVGTVRNGRHVVLTSGQLFGLSKGAVVELHSAGATVPEAATLLSTGTVTESTALEAMVELHQAVDESELAAARAFLVATNREDLKLQLSIRLDKDTWGQTWRTQLSEAVKLLVIDDETPDYTLYEHEGDVFLVDGIPPIKGDPPADVRLVVPVNPEPPVDVERRLLNLARTKLISSVDITSPQLKVRLGLTPADWVGDARGGGDACIARTEVWSQPQMSPGDAVLVTVDLVEGGPAWISLVATNGAGVSEQLFPMFGEPWDARVERGEVFRDCLEVEWDDASAQGLLSAESLRVFAATKPDGIDFRLLLGESLRTKGPTTDQLLEMIWDTATLETKSVRVRQLKAQVSTDSVEFAVSQ